MNRLTAQGFQALQYLLNTGQSVTIKQFDDDHEPVGPLLRRDLQGYFEVNQETRKMVLTKAGLDILNVARKLP